MTHSSRLLKNTLIAALLLFTLVTACKKNKSSNVDLNYYLERLGDMRPDAGGVGFNWAGDPIIKYKTYMYEWNGTTKEWQKLGSALTQGTVYSMIQDKQGRYYICDDYQVLTRTTGDWEPLVLADTSIHVNRATVQRNGNGDVIIRVGDDIKNYYFRKSADAATWVKIKEVLSVDDPNTPCFLGNNGHLYYSVYSRPGSIIYDTYLNISTGAFGLVYDKTEPVNTRFDIDGFLGGITYIHPSGTIYYLDGLELFEFAGTMPAKAVKVQQFINPIDEPAITTLRGLQQIVIDLNGNIKAQGVCNFNPGTHYSAITGNLNTGSMKVLAHPLGQRSIIYNLKGETFVTPYEDAIYKWK